MIQEFIERFNEARPEVLKDLQESPPDSYGDLVKKLIMVLSDGEHESPDPERIVMVDYGSYQGTKVFIIGACGYQPYTYWYTKVSYGSCSACDTFQRICYDSPEEDRPKQFATLMLHLLQSMKEMV